MSKIKTLRELSKICQELKKQGKTVGLITGCFDILHLGHIELFRFAKKHVDVLIVGLENDKTIKISKGPERPIFNFKERVSTLSEIESVDYIFKITKIINFGTSGADSNYKLITKKLKPDALITNPLADKFWKEKKRRAEKLGIRFFANRRKKHRSSSKIIQILENE